MGKYPHAKAGKGVQDNLRKVPDLPSAADSAKLVCDWLLANQDKLAALLSTLEVLISDPPDPNDRYPWARGPLDSASEANIAINGLDWYNRVVAERAMSPSSIAAAMVLRICSSPFCFSRNLNRNAVNAWTHINLATLALTLRKSQPVSAAFLFSDACGQYVPEFELGNAQDTRFYASPSLFAASRNQVSLLCAAAEGQLAYEGTDAPASNFKFGRFTQTVLGLSGSSARCRRPGWGVSCHDLLRDLKSLRRVFYSHWGEKEPFEPYAAVTQTDSIPLIFWDADSFELPLVVMTDPPERMPQYGLVISLKDDPAPPWLKNRVAGAANAWSTTVPPGRDALYAIAIKGAEHYGLLFQPKEPLFDQWVPVP